MSQHEFDPEEFLTKVDQIAAKAGDLGNRMTDQCGRADFTEKLVAEWVPFIKDLRERFKADELDALYFSLPGIVGIVQDLGAAANQIQQSLDEGQLKKALGLGSKLAYYGGLLAHGIKTLPPLKTPMSIEWASGRDK